MKLKRLFTAVLSAALALSLCAMPAMAEDGSTTAGTTSKTATAIDWKKTGSLTIHKYETDTAPTGVHDNGENTTSGTPLNGVTFTLYKVQDDTWLKSYYQGTGTSPAMPQVSDYVDSNGTPKTGVTLPTGIPVTTAGDGTAVASGLELGLYLVVETDKPDAVKQAAEPFLVSIPMTSVDKTNWLYDVTVNPKNVTTYGAATLKKVGYTGSKQDDTAMSGYTFKLYKWNGTAWNQITNKPKNGQDNVGDALGTLTTNDSGTISVDGLTQGVYAFVETGVNSTQGYILDAGTAYVFKLNDEGAMQTATTSDVASTANTFGSAVKTLNYDCVKPTTTGSTTNNLEVINYKPDFTKTVKDRKGNTSATHNADYAIGDKVPFVLTIQVPENIAKLKTFKVTDSVTPTQLAYSEDAVVMGTKNGETTETKLSAATDYTITYNAGKDGFTIDFKGTSTSLTAINDYAGKTITITYTATLQPDAAVVDGTTNTVNKNSAELKYSNKTTVASEPDDSPYTIHEEAAVYTFKAGIHKTDGAGTDLDGVKFDLYKKYDANTDEADGTGVMYKDEHVAFLANDEATRLGLNSTGSSDKWYRVATELTTDTDGKVVANGLPKGEYKFVETQTKKDYNLLTKPVDANLNVDYKTAWRTDTTYDATTGTKAHSVTSTTYQVGGETYTYADIKVINRKGFTLPVTGGFGTLLFSGIGVLLVLAGVGVLFSLKKKSNRA